jgi:hypothetical protein
LASPFFFFKWLSFIATAYQVHCLNLLPETAPSPHQKFILYPSTYLVNYQHHLTKRQQKSTYFILQSQTNRLLNKLETVTITIRSKIQAAYGKMAPYKMKIIHADAGVNENYGGRGK